MSNVIIEKTNDIGFITLNRVERHNSLVPDFLDEIIQAINSLSIDDSISVIIMKANGRTFSTGGDVSAFYDHIDDIENYSKSVVGSLNSLIMAMIDCEKPIVAAVHGMVTGGSIGLVLASDIVILSSKATFTPYYATVGYSPDGGWTALLKEIVGQKRVSHILMTDSTITADQALDWGIASYVVSQDDLYEKSKEIAVKISTLKQGSVAKTKKLLWNREAVLSGLECEINKFIEQITSSEGKQGMKEFLKK
jgi:2-(1,2-epoxy-1,2-dihydrophenyl)acetyl-CoA isomerase